MNTCMLRFPDGYDAEGRRGLIRWQLFLHPQVRDVLATSRPDTLQILHEGAPDLESWTAALAEEGHPAPELVPDPEPSTGRS